MSPNLETFKSDRIQNESNFRNIQKWLHSKKIHLKEKIKSDVKNNKINDVVRLLKSYNL